MATKSEHIEQLLQQIQSTIATEDPDQKLQGLFDDLKAAMADYEAEAPTDESIVENDINYALNDQNLTIGQREQLLKTKLRQIELAQERNESKKGDAYWNDYYKYCCFINIYFTYSIKSNR